MKHVTRKLVAILLVVALAATLSVFAFAEEPSCLHSQTTAVFVTGRHTGAQHYWIYDIVCSSCGKTLTRETYPAPCGNGVPCYDPQAVGPIPAVQ